MKCTKGRWYYRDREYHTLRAALLAAWARGGPQHGSKE